MISLSKWLESVEKNAARIKAYRQPGDGSDGASDCVGLLIGAQRLAGMQYTGTHGSNYYARYYTRDFRKITNANQLKVGEAIFKAKSPSDAGYDLPLKYQKGGASYTGDLRDYYHVGVVISVEPLKIAHCSAGGMHYDTKLGKWGYAGMPKIVQVDGSADSGSDSGKPLSGAAIVDVPNDGTVNVRKAPSGSIVTSLREGAEVNVLDDNGNWAKVEYTVKGTGYIMSKYLKAKG